MYLTLVQSALTRHGALQGIVTRRMVLQLPKPAPSQPSRKE